MWDKPVLLNAAADVLYATAMVAALVAGAMLVARLPAFDLREVKVGGALKHVSRGEVEGVVQRELKGNFFTLDLAVARAAFERVPWVRRASVRRHWPAGLDVALEEHEPLARWGVGALVNTHGEVFRAEYDVGLPMLSGPEGTAREIAIQFAYFSRSLRAIGEKPVEIQLTPRRAWQVKLGGGTTLALGRENVEARLSRFVEAYGRTVGRLGRRIDYVDLRYTNGFAVRIPELRHEAPEPKGGQTGRQARSGA
jgi:cell division protein FtsQ